MLLAPYRVLDLCDERGQLAGQMLAQLGAEVIAIEPPGGAGSRRLAPFAQDSEGTEQSLVHRAYNRGKRSVVLDLQDEVGKAALLDLIAGADVLLDSGGPGALDAIGLSSDVLAGVNPALVHASISAFGSDGPKAGWAATDLTVWAAAGPLVLAGEDDRPPVPVGVPQAFVHGAAESVGHVIAALIERSRSGLGQHIDVSAQQASAQATQSAILAAPNGASTHLRSTGGLKLGGLLLRLLWPCKDGHVSVTFLFGTAIGPFSRRLMEWVHEEGFCDEATRDKDWIGYTMLLLEGTEPVSEYERLKKVIAAFCLTKTKAELLEAALGRNLLIAPVFEIGDVLGSAQYRERDYWDIVDGVTYPGQFAKLSATPRVVLGSAPMLGAHTDEVLSAAHRTPAGLPDVPVDRSPGSRALEGLKVLDLMWVMAGPATSRVLADHGATIVRVESATRVETARTIQPFCGDMPGTERSALFANLNAGKRGIAVDISTEEGRGVILDLVRWADVVLESFSPRAMRNWGLDYEVLRTINPQIVMLSSCLFGQSGPMSSMAGYGTMASALSGFTSVTGWPDRAPCGPYGAYTDYISPRFSTAALLAAIDHHRRTGEGQHIDFSQSEGAIHALAPAILERCVNGREWPRTGTVDRNATPSGIHACIGDEQWLAVACTSEAQRDALQEVVGEASDAAVAAWAATMRLDDAVAALQHAGVPAHGVQNSAECLLDPQLRHRGHFIELPHAELGAVTIEAPRAVLSGTPVRAAWAAPMIGEHTFEVLTQVLGYDADRFSELLVAGVLE